MSAKNAMTLWLFDPMDSLFFREAKPFNMGEGGFLDSVFPPPGATMTGAIRGAVAEMLGLRDWREFHQGAHPDIEARIGPNADNPGALRFAGPWVFLDGERLFPAPLHLLWSEQQGKWTRLSPICEPMETDAGPMRLTAPEESIEGAKPVEQGWLREADFRRVLAGGLPQGGPVRLADLMLREPRTGIARDNARRTVREGMLYFTRHLRFRPGVRLGMAVAGAEDIDPPRAIRLGGEGRFAAVETRPVDCAPLREAEGDAAMVVLLSHADFGGKPEPEWPEGVECIAACTGKAIREGGWDYRQRQPKPLKSLVPAGSVFFVRGGAARMQGWLGKRNALGYGEIAVGCWNDNP